MEKLSKNYHEDIQQEHEKVREQGATLSDQLSQTAIAFSQLILEADASFARQKPGKINKK